MASLKLTVNAECEERVRLLAMLAQSQRGGADSMAAAAQIATGAVQRLLAGTRSAAARTCGRHHTR